ncbi:sodium-independent anion transporter [Methylophaga sp. 41_12_T18]|nr:sodium-independent anion transporter [Methylophaga sp. 41_12_T18]
MFNLLTQRPTNVKNDVLSGLTVALALVPEAVAFAFVAGVEPLVGLYAAFLVGLITAVMGGRPGMISGATGALAVVMVALVAQHGVEYLFATVVLMGILQILAGVFHLGKFIRMVPYPVMLGFVNGLALVIFLAQLKAFKVEDAEGTLQWMSGNPLWIMLALVGLTMFISHFLPKVTKAVPSSLAAIVAVSLLAIGLDLDIRSVGDIASIAGGLPEFSIPSVPFSWETFTIIAPYAFILAMIGLIESLLTLTLIDEITETTGRPNKECVGQGLANTVTGFFGGMGGCAMIGQSMININSGGRGRLSGISAALFLLFFILFAAPLIEVIPIAVLIGVMFMVVLGTFEWATFRLFGRVPVADILISVSVAVITVFTDLAIAVMIGIIISALVFAWQHAKHIYIKSYVNEEGSKVHELNGPLFFGSARNFADLFDPKADADDVILEFKNSRVYDHSAIEAIDNLAERYIKAGKKLHLRHLSEECKLLLKNAGDLIEVNVLEDPQYHVADDKLA